ncbi:MAG: gamma-glutamyltransferase [Bacteroidetes bacterium]|nr:MAG: gamma-glutamyltransferase [Bacteroidota bacterium]
MRNFYKQINTALTGLPIFSFKKVAQTTVVVCIIVALFAPVGKAQTKDSTYQNAVVVSAHPLASQIGIEILKKGGNAFDASIAVEFALAVCYPIAGNIGGGGLLVYRKPNGEIGMLDYREKAPALAYRDMFVDAKGNPVGEKSLKGHFSVGVPGTVAGMYELHQRFGSLPFADLVEPARKLAQQGVPLTEKEATRLTKEQDTIRKYNTFAPCLLHPAGKWKTGDTLHLKELAQTLAYIRDLGRDGFYKGITAERIVREMQKRGGLISFADLENYRATWRRPLVGKYKGHRIITAGTPSAGGLILLQCLKMLELGKFDLAKYGFHSPEAIQAIAEVERRAYADRAHYAGDADFYPVPYDNLLSTPYLRRRISDFVWDKIKPSTEVKAGTFSPTDSEETTHYSIVDKWGNAVSVTTTLNDAYGSRVVVEGAGFLLNDEMDDFSSAVGKPNKYGLVGAEANAIQPFKRPLSSMSPTIVEQGGKLFMVVGTPGGSTIPTSILQVLLNVWEFKMTLKQAVHAPRFHYQWLPDALQPEPDNVLPASVMKALEKKGYSFKIRTETIGRVEAILRKPDGTLQGVGDKRGDDAVVGY